MRAGGPQLGGDANARDLSGLGSGHELLLSTSPTLTINEWLASSICSTIAASSHLGPIINRTIMTTRILFFPRPSHIVSPVYSRAPLSIYVQCDLQNVSLARVAAVE